MSDSVTKHFENDPHYLDNKDLQGTGLKWVTETKQDLMEKKFIHFDVNPKGTGMDWLIETKQDSIVENVVEKYRQRSQVGIEKYGTTLEDSTEDLLAFLNHLQQELMDGSLYCEKAIQIIKSNKNGK